MAKVLPGLRMSPPGVKGDRHRQTWWLDNYSYINLNTETLPISNLSTMKYGRAPEILIREVITSNLELGPVHILKADFRTCFYHIVLRPTYDIKMGIFPPSEV